ncbi:MAG: hypothetical protein A4S09_12650 [Proteobacteria bacterium SG_bin7]|nr:MAG: hypothetical protein A4S09_12650 [Proteobacteria bacterium SG_bin7]
MKKVLIALAMVFGTSGFAEDKMGFINVEKAVDGTTDGKKANDELQKVFKARQDELRKKEDDLKTKRDDLMKKESVLADQVKLRKQMELEKDIAEFQKQGMQYQEEIRKKEFDMKKPILDAIQKIIEDIAKKDSYTMILNAKQGVVWAKNEIDITQRVVDEYEKSKKGKK